MTSKDPAQLVLPAPIDSELLNAREVVRLLLVPALIANGKRGIVIDADVQDNAHVLMTVHDTSTQRAFATLSVRMTGDFLRIYMRPVHNDWLRIVRDPDNDRPANEYNVEGNHRLVNRNGLTHVLEARKVIARIVSRTLRDDAFDYIFALVTRADEKQRYEDTPYFALRSLFSTQQWRSTLDHTKHNGAVSGYAITLLDQYEIRVNFGTATAREYRHVAPLTPYNALPNESMQVQVTVHEITDPNKQILLASYDGRLSDYDKWKPGDPAPWHLTGDVKIPVDVLTTSGNMPIMAVRFIRNTLTDMHDTLYQAYQEFA